MLHLQLSDREVERVLAGQQPIARPDLAEVAYFVARLRALNDFETPPPMSPALRQQLEAASRAQRRVANIADHTRSTPSRVEVRRRAERARWRWRLVGAAAVFVMLGGIAVAGLQGSGSRQGNETKTGGDSTEEPTNAPASHGPEETKPPAATADPQVAEEAPPTDAPPPQADLDPDGAPAAVTPETAPPSSAPQNPGGSGWFDWPDECAPQDWVCWWNHFGSGQGSSDGPPGQGDGNGHSDDNDRRP